MTRRRPVPRPAIGSAHSSRLHTGHTTSNDETMADTRSTVLGGDMGRSENLARSTTDIPGLDAFAQDLRQLRVRAGKPTLRQLAERTDYSATSLARVIGGDRLPSLNMLLAYVRATGGDTEEWERRWRELVKQASGPEVRQAAEPGVIVQAGVINGSVHVHGLSRGRSLWRSVLARLASATMSLISILAPPYEVPTWRRGLPAGKRISIRLHDAYTALGSPDQAPLDSRGYE